MHRWKEERMNERHWTAADGWTVGTLGGCAELTLRVESAGVCTDHHRSLDDGHIGVLPPAVNRHRVSLSLLLSYAINNSSTSSSAATAGHCRHHRHHRIATDRPLLAMHVVVWSRCDQWQGQEDRKRKKNCSSAWVDPIYSLEEEEERRKEGPWTGRREAAHQTTLSCGFGRSSFAFGRASVSDFYYVPTAVVAT